MLLYKYVCVDPDSLFEVNNAEYVKLHISRLVQENVTSVR